MPWSRGTRFGPYEIETIVGRGGMGEVYKARDIRLDRLVALKVLHDPLAAAPPFRERFAREARILSQLDHPHICPVYDVGEQAGTAFFVMPYLEGETLRTRLGRGRLPLDEVLRYAVQIADALDKAHRAGVIHRDLKPENIFLTTTGARLLDFGLAKKETRPGAGDETQDGALSRALTVPGAVLGTLQYMAPEQLEDKPVDPRTDIFAFGIVLHEMLTGRAPFEAEFGAGVVAAILRSEPPPVGVTRPATPRQLEHLVGRCLAKDPDERWQTSSDLMRELKWIAEEVRRPVGTRPAPEKGARQGVWKATTFLVAAVAVALAAAFFYLRPWRMADDRAAVRQFPIRLAVSPPPETLLTGVQFAISPDGASVAFVALAGQRRQLWVYSLASGESHVVTGADDARFPFWSADGTEIAFLTDRGLMRAVSGGPPQGLAAASDASSGAWNDRGVLLFAGRDQPGIYRVASSGGPTTRVTTPSRDREELLHLHPRFLPDGERFLYLARSRRPEFTGVYVGSLDADNPKLLVRTASHAEYAAPGYLLYVRDSVLVAQRLNLDRLELEGDPVAVAEGVLVNTDNGGSGVSVSRDGCLVYHAAAEERGALKWVDRRGQIRPVVRPQAWFRGVELSPDGRKALVKIRGTEVSLTGDLSVLDLASSISSRLTFDAEVLNGRWSSDGGHVFFDSRRRDAARGIYSKRADGSGPEQFVWRTDGMLADVATDGRLLIEEGNSCSVVQPGAQPMPAQFLQSALPVGCGRFSPDGRFIAYTLNEPGRSAVYVAPIPAGTPRTAVSADGGLEPRWRRDGRELFYLSPAGVMMSVRLTRTPTFAAAAPQPLFRTGTLASGPSPQYSVNRDGDQFLMIDTVADPAVERLTVIVHWQATLKITSRGQAFR